MYCEMNKKKKNNHILQNPIFIYFYFAARINC